MRRYIKKTITFYDKNVDRYYEKTKDLQDVSQLKTFLSLLPKHAKILDVGCAFGRDSASFIQKGHDVYGIDLSEKMIERAQLFVPNATFFVMDLLHLQFNDAFFDGIWCGAVLIHVSKKDIPIALTELSRILKRGGILYIHVKEG